MARYRWMLRTAVAVSGVLAFMGVSAWANQPWWEYAFRSDGSPVAWLSSALLAANAAVTLKLTFDGSVPYRLGGWLAPTLALAAIDEQFLLHERFKHSEARLIWGEEYPLSRWIGDLPTLMVGVVGVVLVWVFTRTVRQKIPCRLIQAAVALGLFGLWADLGSPPAWLRRVEEGIEVLAETLFLCALLEVSSAQVQSSSSS